MFSKRLKDLMNERNVDVINLRSKMNLNASSMIYRWLNSTHIPTLETANKLANIFNCSLDYLFGLSDDDKYIKEKELKLFSVQFRKVIDEMKIVQQKLIKECKISPNSINRWLHNKSQPDMASILKLANYLNVSIDYLVGRD